MISGLCICDPVSYESSFMMRTNLLSFSFSCCLISGETLIVMPPSQLSLSFAGCGPNYRINPRGSSEVTFRLSLTLQPWESFFRPLLYFIETRATAIVLNIQFGVRVRRWY